MKDRLSELRTSMDNTVFKDEKFTEQNKRNVRNGIHKKSIRRNWVPNFLTATFAIAFLVWVAYFIGEELELFGTAIITDDNTKPVVELVVPPENALFIQWRSDAMDRGNHDYETPAHSELVVDPDNTVISRGDVIYFKTPARAIEDNPNLPEYYIARAVGLPGETVEIKEGQVFINNKKLDTFYAIPTMWGRGKEEYFKNMDSSDIANEKYLNDYFATSMQPVKVTENTIFVLVDQWWRGTDSKDFGLLPMASVVGKVLGYKDTYVGN